MMKLPIVCIGAGGHAGMIVEILENDSQYEIVGLLDKEPAFHGKTVQGVPVLGSDELLMQLKAEGIQHFVVGIGATKSCQLRKAVYDHAMAVGMEPITVVHPSALVMKSASIGRGSVVMPGVVINRNARIGCNVILNSRSVVEHDVVVGDHSHLATAACVAGGVNIGKQVIVGANSVIREAIVVNDKAVIGAGSVVVKNVEQDRTVVGSPAKELVRTYE